MRKLLLTSLVLTSLFTMTAHANVADASNWYHDTAAGQSFKESQAAWEQLDAESRREARAIDNTAGTRYTIDLRDDLPFTGTQPHLDGQHSGTATPHLDGQHNQMQTLTPATQPDHSTHLDGNVTDAQRLAAIEKAAQDSVHNGKDGVDGSTGKDGQSITGKKGAAGTNGQDGVDGVTTVVTKNVVDTQTRAVVQSHSQAISSNSARISKVERGVAQNSKDIAQNRKDIKVAGAHAQAAAGLHFGSNSGYAAAIGGYDGEAAVAVGVQYAVHDAHNSAVTLQVTGGDDEVGGAVGIHGDF